MREENKLTRAEYERRVQQFVGNTITKVVYSEIDYFDDQFHFFDDDRFDSIDFGIEFELGTSNYVCLSWGAEFHQYGVSLVDGSMSEITSSKRLLDVSDSKRWRKVLGKTIESVDLFWSSCEIFEKPETRVWYPQDLLLRFAGNGTLIISALEIRENDWHMGMMDHITVFDALKMARKFKCLTATNY